ncbi:glycerol-3-phosphate O-acyltransferase 3/4 [Pancytospora epiphaga]|nr:glycerol-3-phosphate O-acyltransferase 3/4 [Pancytospora epiphaga]
MLIFPEGTVVNNEYIVMFQKGAFELDVPVCPVGIKYRKNLMDPYWNRRNSCFTLHLFYLITRWRIDVDVHWMAPVRRRREESSVSFSYRVKNLIARKTGLRNTLWNGYFKSSPIMRDLILFRTAYCNIYKRQNESLFERNKNVATARGHLHLLDESIYRRKTDSRVYLNGITYDMFVNECCKEYIRLKAHYFTIKQQSASFLNVGTVDAV